MVVTSFAAKCPLCEGPSSLYAQQCTFWKLALISPALSHFPIRCNNIPAPAPAEIIRSHISELQEAENEASNLLCETFCNSIAQRAAPAVRDLFKKVVGAAGG